MGMFYDFEVIGLHNEIYHVQVISNSIVSELNLIVDLALQTNICNLDKNSYYFTWKAKTIPADFAE